MRTSGQYAETCALATPRMFGFMTAELFPQWLQHFARHARPTKFYWYRTTTSGIAIWLPQCLVEEATLLLYSFHHTRTTSSSTPTRDYFWPCESRVLTRRRWLVGDNQVRQWVKDKSLGRSEWLKKGKQQLKDRTRFGSYRNLPFQAKYCVRWRFWTVWDHSLREDAWCEFGKEGRRAFRCWLSPSCLWFWSAYTCHSTNTWKYSYCLEVLLLTLVRTK